MTCWNTPYQAEGPSAGFDLLIRKLLEQQNYALAFEARLMQNRHALGLPLIFHGTLAEVAPEHRSAVQFFKVGLGSDRGVGGSNPLAPTNFPQNIRICEWSWPAMPAIRLYGALF